MNEQKDQTFQRNLEKERITLEKAMKKFENTIYHCEADAQEAWETFQKAYQPLFSLKTRVVG
ncbi:hypothetical protein ELQ35_01650 [Peribacillus cavernae]|uniref:Uncharacterized protein n=1 Tax=Peribacillus cavernae TaxID=1674310 RepID=A0A3S0U939_9BACI|nr:hypothetical protein [Peribacillus cavernae]RUQ32816.1 hypothetical protein ELQ35_01650 [Peribacillus cavernae]